MIHLAVPNLCGNEKKYLDDCIDTTFVSSVGEYVNRFEEMVAKATGSNNAVATSSGTTGLHAALTTVGVQHGELVIIPTFTFIATANAISHCGAIPWLMDIDEDTWCLDVRLVEEALSEKCIVEKGDLIHRESGRRVAAIMPVYTLGNVPDMKAFRLVADKYNLPLVVDAACAMGATLSGNYIGKLADLSVFSFNGNKTVTSGGGGAIVGDDELLKRVKHLTTTARATVEYDFDEVGFNYRMTNIQAAVGCAQMENLDLFVERKRQIRNYYNNSFNDTLWGKFPETNGSSCWFSGIVLEQGKCVEDTRKLAEGLKKHDIEARVFWKPVHLQKPYVNAPKESVVRSEELWERILTLPCSTNITDEELGLVVETLKKVYT